MCLFYLLLNVFARAFLLAIISYRSAGIRVRNGIEGAAFSADFRLAVIA
ncbi:MAG: hypothetical protein P1U61_09280 [Legionellaceae bacterium]|nr:hypothetical protein [Legionellaceae bacterium]